MLDRAVIWIAAIAIVGFAADALAKQPPNGEPTRPPPLVPAPAPGAPEPTRPAKGAASEDEKLEPETPADVGVPPETVPESKVETGTVVSKEGGHSVVEKKTLTPIVPEPEAPPGRTYQLYWELDVPVFGIALVLGAGRFVRTSQRDSPASCLPTNPNSNDPADPDRCDRNELNALDQPFAGRWRPAWGAYSDIALAGMLLAPPVLLTADEGFLNAMNDSVVIYQATLIGATLSSVSSLGSGRPRPFVYKGEAPEEERYTNEGSLSFFSGHTALAFALSTATFWTVRRRHGSSAYSWLVLGVGSAAAVSVGGARVLAGKHFPTDALAGMVVGVSSGTLIPMLHGTPVRVVPTAERRGAMLSVSRAF